MAIWPAARIRRWLAVIMKSAKADDTVEAITGADHRYDDSHLPREPKKTTRRTEFGADGSICHRDDRGVCLRRPWDFSGLDLSAARIARGHIGAPASAISPGPASGTISLLVVNISRSTGHLIQIFVLNLVVLFRVSSHFLFSVQIMPVTTARR